MTREEQKIIIYRESLIQSIFADIMSVVFLIGTFWFNVNYIQSKMLSVILLFLFILKLFYYASQKKNVFTDKKSAIDFLSSH